MGLLQNQAPGPLRSLSEEIWRDTIIKVATHPETFESWIPRDFNHLSLKDDLPWHNNIVTTLQHTVTTLVPTGPMVTRYTGGLSQLPVVEMSWGKKSKKKPSVLINFRFLVNFIRHTGPMVTMVTRCTGSLSQLPVVEMSWGKNLRKNQKFWPTFIIWSISLDKLVAWSPQVVLISKLK